MANKKRIATSVAAVATAAALLLGGTFAWQSISQTALNEASDIVNPGGRLHDDFNGTNKDVYVENFADEPIYARVRLGEYMEIVVNKGMGEGIENMVPVIGDKTEENGEVKYKYITFTGYDTLDENNMLKAGVDSEVPYSADAEEGADGYAWWSWKMGGQTTYMPTFNLNKDSLAADVNGTYAGPDGVDGVTEGDDADRYTDYVEYALGETKNAIEIYDADSNSDDELKEVDVSKIISGADTTDYSASIKKVDASHTAKLTDHSDAQLISMEKWLELTEDEQKEKPYWVYDTDGWVYWSAPIPGRNEDGTTNTTSLLMDGITLNQVMDDSWYYAIQVTGQFITADDMGSIEDGTGFYDSDKGAPPSDNALLLLAAIGVDVDGSDTGGDTGGEEEYLVPDENLPRTEFESDEDVPTTTVERGKVYFPSTLYDADGKNIGITTLEITSANGNHTSYIGANRIGAPVIAIAADEPNDTLTLEVKTVKDDPENPVIRHVTLNIIGDVSGGGTSDDETTYKNTVVYGGTAPNEANMLSTGTTTVVIYDENGKAFDFSEGSGNYLALSVDGEHWYVNVFDPNGFNAASILGEKNSSAMATKLGVAKLDEAPEGSVVDSSEIVWQDTQYLFIYYDVIHEYVQSCEYNGTTYFVMKDLVAENNTLCVIDPSNFQGGEQGFGCVIYSTDVTDVNSIDWENLTSCGECKSEKPTT